MINVPIAVCKALFCVCFYLFLVLFLQCQTFSMLWFKKIFLDKRLSFSCIFIRLLCIPSWRSLNDQRYIFKGCFCSVDICVDLCVLFEGQLTGLCSVFCIKGSWHRSVVRSGIGLYRKPRGTFPCKGDCWGEIGSYDVFNSKCFSSSWDDKKRNHHLNCSEMKLYYLTERS